MKNWRPESWSKQARRKADVRFKNSDDLTLTFYFLRLDYEQTHSLRELRAIKRFGKLRRKNNMVVQYLGADDIYERMAEREEY